MTSQVEPPHDAPQIEREEGASKGRYVIRDGDHEAEMTYSRAGERLIIIDHTGVPDAFRFFSTIIAVLIFVVLLFQELEE